MDMQANDEDLAERAAAGDAGAFRCLLERHYDRVYRLAFRLTGLREDAEDLAQDICASLPKRLQSFRGQAKFTTWLYRVVLNAARDMHRRKASANRATDGYEELASLERDGREEDDDQTAWLYATLDRIGGDLRETAILVLAEERTHAEAAEILSVKESTVSWRMSKLKEKLKSIAKADA